MSSTGKDCSILCFTTKIAGPLPSSRLQGDASPRSPRHASGGGELLTEQRYLSRAKMFEELRATWSESLSRAVQHFIPDHERRRRLTGTLTSKERKNWCGLREASFWLRIERPLTIPDCLFIPAKLIGFRFFQNLLSPQHEWHWQVFIKSQVIFGSPHRISLCYRSYQLFADFCLLNRKLAPLRGIEPRFSPWKGAFLTVRR